jgi:hypothetical protein
MLYLWVKIDDLKTMRGFYFMFTIKQLFLYFIENVFSNLTITQFLRNFIKYEKFILNRLFSAFPTDFVLLGKSKINSDKQFLSIMLGCFNTFTRIVFSCL